MRIFLLIITLTTLSTFRISAQEKTLLGNDELSYGGFGGPVVKYVYVHGEPGVLIGGRGGWIINHSVVIGGGAYGLANDIKADVPPFVDESGNIYNTFINFGYGGLELEYIMQSDQLLHFSVSTLIGGGEVGYRYKLPGADGDGWDSNKDAFFIFEPSLNTELNVVSFMRVGLGVSYRFISGVNLDDPQNKDLAGPSGILTFKFGNF